MPSATSSPVQSNVVTLLTDRESSPVLPLPASLVNAEGVTSRLTQTFIHAQDTTTRMGLGKALKIKAGYDYDGGSTSEIVQAEYPAPNGSGPLIGTVVSKDATEAGYIAEELRKWVGNV
ncbi:hypothetical protein YB2330_004951 [Saitoella coloradoensis]